MTFDLFRNNISQSALIFLLLLSSLFLLNYFSDGTGAGSIAGSSAQNFSDNVGSAAGVSGTVADSSPAQAAEGAMSGSAAAASSMSKATGSSAAAAKGQIANTPAYFIPNEGQKDASTLFYAAGSGYDFYAEKAGVTYLFEAGSNAEGSSAYSLNIKFAGANANPTVVGANELEGKVNYLIGQDESNWQTDLSTFGGVTYQNLYPGIDLTYQGGTSKIKYEFKVAPGANPANIGLAYSGANGLKTDASGNLLIATPMGELKDEAPTAYQLVNGKQVPVDAAFAVAGSTVGFTLGSYNKSLPLFVDPGIVYSTFLGGSGADEANDIYVDASGNMFVTGGTDSTNFPATADAGAGMSGPLDRRYNSGGDVFVSKFNASGDLVYSTFIGGSAADEGKGIRVNSAGEIVVAGNTSSYNYPCPFGGFDRFWNGGSNPFITILNPAGDQIVVGSFYGKTSQVFGLELGLSDEPIIIGAGSGGIGELPSKPGGYGTGSSDVGSLFVTKFFSDLSDLTFTAFFRDVTVTDFVLDNNENVYLTGYTSSSSFDTTVGAFDESCGAGTIFATEDDCIDGRSDAVAVKLNSSGASLDYSTYLGGFGYDFGQSIAVNDVGNAFISGASDSCDFPWADPNEADYFDNCLNGLFDEFVLELNDAGSADVYFQRFGGQLNDGVSGTTPLSQHIDLDSSGNPVIVGYTQSEDFPITAGAIDNNLSEATEVFISRIDIIASLICCSGLDNSNLSYSTFFGWGFTPQINGIQVDQNDILHLAGGVSTSAYPTTRAVPAGSTTVATDAAFDPTPNGGQDAFVTKIDLIGDVKPVVNVSVNPSIPDGDNLWYKKKTDSLGNLIPPAISLLSTGTGSTFYQWNTQAGNWITYSGPFEPLEGDNVLYFYGSDQSGATGDVATFDIKWDPIDPSVPSLTSTSHEIDVPSNNQVISFDLGADFLTADSTSGIDYFNFKLGPACNDNDEQTFTATTDSRFFNSGVAPLSQGSYTLMIQSVDNAGNDGLVSCFGPYIIDTTSPVTSITTSPASNDGHYDWFKSIPLITLATEQGAKTFYKWDASFDNTGYYYATVDAQTIGTGGATLDIRGDDVAGTLNFDDVDLPFDFNYFGATYDTVFLSSNGLLTFEEPNTSHLNSASALQGITGIAPLWDDLRTDGHATDDIYVATSDSWISFRWQSRVYSIGDEEVNFEVVLYKDGKIRFNYGQQDGSLSATIGISNGECATPGDCIVSDDITGTDMQMSRVFIPSLWSEYEGPFNGLSGIHTLYYYSVDTAGNSENPIGSRIFKVDPDRPVGVTGLTSATHTISTPTSVATIEVHWDPAIDPISSADGYSVEWSTLDPVAYFNRGENHPDSSMDVNKDETATSDTFTATVDGNWYFYIRVKDNAGHWSNGDSIGPFEINSSAGVPDTIKPDTFILSGPSGTIASSSATFTFTGTDNVTASGDLVYSAMLVGKDATFDGFSSATFRSYTGLTNGSYTFRVRARDTASPANNIDDTPAEQAFTVLSTESSLTIINTGTGSGTVRSTPDAGVAINCGVDCSETYPSSTDVTLFASADPGSFFFGWTGAAVSCGSNPTCNIDIPINTALSATATFKTIPVGATYDETSAGIVYDASCWSIYTDPALYGGTAKISKKKGCKATFSFTGESVTLVSARAKQLGKAKIFIDGVLQTTVDLYNSTTLAQQEVYTKSFGTSDLHTITVQVDGTKNASATGFWVPIDAFAVFG